MRYESVYINILGTLYEEINGGATSLFNFRRSGKTSAINLKSKGENGLPCGGGERKTIYSSA